MSNPVLPTNQKILTEHLLRHNVAQIYPTTHALGVALASGRKLRVYAGFDPTSPHLHIGHALLLEKLRQFQELGFEVIMVIGSFTAMIGDPTDKTATRSVLTAEQVKANAATYPAQAGKIIAFDGPNPARLEFNDRWLSPLTLAEIITLSSNFTVQQMLERDMFESRIEAGKPIGLHEFLYPLMQGFDSVALDVDVEIGGTDQTFNMLAGRTLMKAGVLGHPAKEKFVITTSLLTNDAGKKMSKSEGGMICLDDSPEEMFGKVMALSDDLILPYQELVLGLSMAQLVDLKSRLTAGENPRQLKVELAQGLVAKFHSPGDAKTAALAFDARFRDHQIPANVPIIAFRPALTIQDCLLESGLASSKTQCRQLVVQGGIKLNQTAVTDLLTLVSPGDLIAKGKLGLLKIM